MKSGASQIPATQIEKATPVTRSSRKRLIALVILFAGLAAVLPVSRRFLVSKPGPPPASASLSAKIKHYANRVESDPSDVSAYVELGSLEEATGYFHDSLRHLYIAQALGASPHSIMLPMGRALTNLARFDEATAVLTKAVVEMPDNLEAAANLAGLYDSMGETDKSIRALRNYVDAHPAVSAAASPVVLNETERLMFCFADAGDKEMTLKMAQNIIKLNAALPEGYSVAGKLLVERGDYQGALPLLETAVKLAGNEAANCYNYGLALSKSGKKLEAVAQWQRTVALNPSAIDAYYRLAEYYADKKDYKQAADTLQTIALRNLKDSVVIRAAAVAFEKSGDKTAAAYWRAVDARMRKDYAASLTYASKVVENPAWRTRALILTAEAYKGLNRIPDYISTMKKLTASGTAESDVAMADAYGIADKMDDQITSLKTALTKNPKDPASVHYRLAQVAQRKGNRDEQEKELEQCTALSPDDPVYRQDLSNVYFERRTSGDRLQKAIQEYKHLIRLNPNEDYGYRKLGIAYAAAGDLHRAVRNLEHSLDLQPGEGSTYQELGRVYARLGDKTNSEKMLQLYSAFVAFDLKRQTLVTRSRSSKRDPAAHVALCEFMEKAGDYTSAARYYRQASALKPADESIKSHMKRIAVLMGRATGDPAKSGGTN